MLSLIVAASLSAVDIERAFAADAQKLGQWTAFRKYAGEGAVMFVPQPIWARAFLGQRKDPPRAIAWAPAESWLSCDGRTAINRGPWTSASGSSQGYFTTVWIRKSGTWNWVYDGGDSLSPPPARAPKVRIVRARCAGRDRIPAQFRPKAWTGAPGASGPPPSADKGGSPDGTLIYEWNVAPSGERLFRAKLWTGRHYDLVLDQRIPAPRG